MAQGNYGTPNNPYQIVHGEQWVITPRTSDPNSPSKGEMWLRTDLNSGDKIATIRWQNASGTQDVPVFPTTTDPNSSDIKKVLRVQTPNGLGWVPVLEGGGAYSELGLQHGGIRHGWHDSLVSIELIDDFEYGQSGSLSDNYYGITSSYNITTSNVVEGAEALEYPDNETGLILSSPGDGLPAYPNAGDTVGFLLRDPGSVPGIVLNGDRPNENGYLFTLQPGNGIRILRIDNGSLTGLNTTSVSLSSDTWYWCEVDVAPDSGGNEGDMEFRAYDLNTGDLSRGSLIGTVSTTDTNYVDNRGVGARNLSDAAGAGADWIRII